MRNSPLVPPALALIIGILTQHFALTTATAWILLPLTISVIAIGLCLTFSAPPRTTMCCIILLFVNVGLLIGHISEPRNNISHYSHISDGRHSVVVRLTTTPYAIGQHIYAKADAVGIDNRSVCGQLRIIITCDSFNNQPTLHYGDTLHAKGLLLSTKQRMYVYSANIDTICMGRSTIRQRCEGIRIYLLHRMSRGPMDKEKNSLAEALVLGWKSNITPPIRTAFRDAGISHLLAVSGLHVGIVAALVQTLLFFLPRTRRGRLVRGIVQGIAVWTFVVISGAANSSIRAALMISCLIISHVIGRRTSALNILALTAIITLTVSPQLLFDTGWQLSYSAVGGLLCCAPLFNKINNKILKYAAVSATAYIATLPITATVFHTLTTYFLIANIIIVPLSGVLVAASLLYMIIPCRFTQLLLSPLYDFVQAIVGTISQWPYANIVITSQTSLARILLWLGSINILLAVRFIAQHRKQPSPNSNLTSRVHAPLPLTETET